MLAVSSRQEGYNLKKYSVNAVAEARGLAGLTGKEKVQALKQNLDSYVNHVLEDNVVSLPYRYRLNERGEVAVWESGQKVHLDERERGGYYKKGLTEALSFSINNPGQVTLLYSPPGITSFDGDPDNPYTQVGKYRDGQLYVMYADGAKVNNVAVSVSKEGESWVKRLMGGIFEEAHRKPTEIERIAHMISHPYLTGLDLDGFLDTSGSLSERLVYKNNKDYEFGLYETLALLRRSFSGGLRPAVESHLLEGVLGEEILDEEFILNSYKHLILHYMESQGLKSLRLSGSCGSDEKFKISDLVNTVEGFLNNFSSLDRLLKERLPKELQEKDKEKKDTYPCPHCTQPIPYEKNVKDKSTWMTNCPHCGMSIKNIC